MAVTTKFFKQTLVLTRFGPLKDQGGAAGNRFGTVDRNCHQLQRCRAFVADFRHGVNVVTITANAAEPDHVLRAAAGRLTIDVIVPDTRIVVPGEPQLGAAAVIARSEER